MKRILCFVLALLMLSFVFVGCGNKKKPNDAEGTRPSGEEEDDVDYGTLGKKDWEGRELKVLGVYNSHETSFEIAASSADESDQVSPVVFSRNNELSKLFNVDIIQCGDEDAHKTFARNITTGEVDYDIAFRYRDDMATDIANGYFLNIMRLPYIQWTQPYYKSNTIESMQVSGRLYHMVSDFSLTDKNRVAALYLNRDLATSFEIPDIPEMVKDMTWTVEEFSRYVKKVSLDLDDNGKMEYTTDRFGLVVGSTGESARFWSGCGESFVKVDDDGTYEFTFASDRSIQVIEKLRTVLGDKDLVFYSTTADDYAGAGKAFRAGRALFYQAVVISMRTISKECKFSYTILPDPLFNTDQTRYYTNNNNYYCPTFGVPICARDPEFSAFMIEALSWKSSTTSYVAFYDIYCKLRASYDQVCSDMLDVLFENMSLEFGFMYDNVLRTDAGAPEGMISAALRGVDGKEITTSYAAGIDNLNVLIEELLNKMKRRK